MPWWRTRSDGEAERAHGLLGAVDAARASRGRPPCRRGCARRGTASPACRRSARPARGRARAPRPCRRRPRAAGARTPCSAAARRPGRQSPASSALAPDSSTRVAAPGGELGERVVELGLAEVAAVGAVAPVAVARELVGRDRLVRDADRARRPAARPRARRPRPPARRRSPPARAARARAPRPRPRATSPRRPRTRRPRSRGAPTLRSSSAQQRSCSPAVVRGRERLRPHGLHRRAADAGGALAVGVLGREVDDAGRRAGRPSRAPARRPPRRCGSRARARSRSSRAMRTPSVLVSRSIAVATACSSRRPGERGQHEARAPVLHLRRRGPDVERAGGEAGGRRVRRELGEQVVEVRLDQRDRPRRRARSRRRRSRGRRWAARRRRACRRRSRRVSSVSLGSGP